MSEDKVEVYVPSLPPRYLWLTHSKPAEEGFYCFKMYKEDKNVVVPVWMCNDDGEGELYTCIDDQVRPLSKVADHFYWGVDPIPDGVVLPRTVLFQSGWSGLQHKGLKPYRFNDNPHEEIFAEEWEKLAKNDLLGYILSVDNRKDGVESQRDATVAATVIQWLGSPVGWSFLRETVEKCGYDLVRKDES